MLTEANLRDAILANASLRSSALMDADLSGADLKATDMRSAWLFNTDLTGANLKNANVDTASIRRAILTSDTVYNQWTVFSDDFDPKSAGLTLVTTPLGDIDADGSFNVDDLNLLSTKIRTPDSGLIPYWWDDVNMFDMNGDGRINPDDAHAWVTDFKQTHLGDANLDGEVAFSDFLSLSEHFGQPGRWREGDFDLSGDVQFP